MHLKAFYIHLIFICCCLHANIFAQTKTFDRYDTLRGSLSPLRNCFDVHYYNLNLKVIPEGKYIQGSNTIYFKTTSTCSKIQVDISHRLRIDSIIHNNTGLKFERDGDAVFIQFTKAIPSLTFDSIKVHYAGKPVEALNPPWEGGFIWTKDTEGNHWVAVTCEGDGASLWWPCKDHPYDEADSAQMTFTVPANLKCISNGNLISQKRLEDFVSYTWKVHYPINNYNITLNIGDYVELKDIYTRKDSSTLDLSFYVLQPNKNRALEYFQQVKPMLVCFEKYFNPYPFPKDGYALVETPYLGMEHQSAIAYGNKFRKNMLGFDYIIIHESAHEWWGNNVSACDHADLWIQESFTTYSEALFIECMFDFSTSLSYLSRQRAFIKNNEPIKGPYNVNYHYWQDSDMYYKGSWMLHTLRSVLDNDSLWFSILKEIQGRYAQKQICSDELINFISLKTNQNLSPFFNQYLLHPDIPVFEYKIQKRKNKFYLNYRIKASENEFILPLKITLNDGRSIKIIAEKHLKKIELKENDARDFKIPTDLYYIRGEKLNKSI